MNSESPIKTIESAFEDSVFSNIQSSSKMTEEGRKSQAKGIGLTFSKDPISVLQANTLNFNSIRGFDKKMSFHQKENGYSVKLSRAFSLDSLVGYLKKDNNIDLTFDPSMQSFEPEEGLVMKSKIPLWVISKTSPKEVFIKRIW